MDLFYLENIRDRVVIEGETYKHLRAHHIKTRDKIFFTNGKGLLATGKIVECMKQKIIVDVLEVKTMPPRDNKAILYTPILKQTERLDWLVEKTVELGVSELIPIITERTIKTTIKLTRLQNIIKYSSLQSLKFYFPHICEPIFFEEAIKNNIKMKRTICYCGTELEKTQFFDFLQPKEDIGIFIGPEGDFTIDEVNKAIHNGIIPVSLGKQRLRSETAAIVSLTIFAIKNNL